MDQCKPLFAGGPGAAAAAEGDAEDEGATMRTGLGGSRAAGGAAGPLPTYFSLFSMLSFVGVRNLYLFFCFCACFRLLACETFAWFSCLVLFGVGSLCLAFCLAFFSHSFVGECSQRARDDKAQIGTSDLFVGRTSGSGCGDTSCQPMPLTRTHRRSHMRRSCFISPLSS